MKKNRINLNQVQRKTDQTPYQSKDPSGDPSLEIERKCLLEKETAVSAAHIDLNTAQRATEGSPNLPRDTLDEPWIRVHYKDIRIPDEDTASGSCSPLSVYDESGLVFAGVTMLNFIGEDVYVRRDPVTGMVNVYIPPQNFASNFNDNNGETNATVASVSGITRRISTPTSEGVPFSIGDWAGASEHLVITSATISYATPEAFRLYAPDSTLKAEVLDASMSVVAQHSILLTENTSSSENGISLSLSDFLPDRARVSVTFSLATILPSSGRFTIRITQENPGLTDYTKTQTNLFYDPNSENPDIDSVTLTLPDGDAVYRWLSGVRYYTVGTPFTLSVLGLDWFNLYSFPTQILSVNTTNFGGITESIAYTALSGWTSLYNLQDASFLKTYTITRSNYWCAGPITASARPLDTGVDTVSNPTQVLIHTYTDNATRIFEDFRSETYRLQEDYTSWDSEESLRTNTGLQILGTRLVYPQSDFSVFIPEDNPDYRPCAGHRTYIRHFWHTGTSHSNGLFQLYDTNLTESLMQTKEVELWISLDTIRWYTLNEDYLGGPSENGSGCRINPESMSLSAGRMEFTLGSGLFTTEDSDWGVYLKMLFKETAKSCYIGSIEITNWM